MDGEIDMKLKFALIIFIFMGIIVPGRVDAAKGGAASRVSGSEEDLVIGIMSLDPAIVAVRPASVREPARPHFPIVWTPAVTLRDKTSVEAQLAIAQRVADFVVKFQGGVPTVDVMGGVIAFVEGEGWNPEIGQVFYRVESPRASAEVWVGVRTVGEGGNISCCDDVGRIGTITGNRFQPDSADKIIPALKAALKSQK